MQRALTTKGKRVMDERLSGVLKTLRSEEATLRGEAQKLKAELKEKEADLKRVRAALAALGEKPSGRAKKPACSKAEVANAIAQVLQAQGVLEQAKLQTQVEELISKAGKSRMGFALRFKEALKDERFIDLPAGYRLDSGDDSPSAAAGREQAARRRKPMTAANAASLPKQ